MKKTVKKRCAWPGQNELMIRYHDTEWGLPLHNDTKLFEALIIDGFQAGLSWQTTLNKRENFRKAFDNFDAQKIAKYTKVKKNSLLKDAGIIRNHLKIDAAIDNAQAFLAIQKEFGNFDKYIWQFTAQKQKKNTWKQEEQIPATSAESDAMSKDLRARGFRFVGPTICYAFMQGTGMVNDHVVSCFRYNEVSR